MGTVLEELTAIRTVAEMTEAFHDEARCRRLVEVMVWPNGRLCPACGSRRSITLAGRDTGRRRFPAAASRSGTSECR
ncbi:transposase [Azospirillum argentinense]